MFGNNAFANERALFNKNRLWSIKEEEEEKKEQVNRR